MATLVRCKRIFIIRNWFSIAIIISVWSVYNSYGQDSKHPENDEYCTPNVAGLPRGKGIVLKYEIIPDFNISYAVQNSGTNETEIKHNGRLDFKVRFPVINKPQLTVITGARYSQEQFHFKTSLDKSLILSDNFDDRNLKSAGMQVYVIKPTQKNTYFLLRVSADLNGDFTTSSIPLQDFLKVSVAPMFGWKKSDDLSYAVGLVYGYLFGRPSIYPVFSYNRNFTKRL